MFSDDGIITDEESGRVADLPPTDDGTLEMNDAEGEQLWDLLAVLQTFWKHVTMQTNPSLQS